MQTLPSITTPSLLLHGGDDDICYPAGSQEMHDKLGSKQKTLTILPGLYHEILNEPGFDKLVQQILAFYDADDIQDAQQSTANTAAVKTVSDNVAAKSSDVETGVKSGSAPQREVEMHSISLDN
eukprot:10294-Heterococcus_DN1.PRE.3